MPFRKILNINLVLMSLCCLTIAFYFTNKLRLYVHPRYFEFNLALSLVGLFFWLWSNSKFDTHHKSQNWKSTIMLGLLLTAVAIVPITSLSSKAAYTRGASSLTNTNLDTKISVLGKINNDLTNLGIDEWVTLLSQNQNQSLYKDKKAKIVGFITPDKTNPDIFYATRFKLNCCTVDVQPLSVAVFSESWRESLSENQWVEIEGTFAPLSGSETLHLYPTNLRAVDEPKDPYL